jgi:hypothetical protein
MMFVVEKIFQYYHSRNFDDKVLNDVKQFVVVPNYDDYDEIFFDKMMMIEEVDQMNL